MNTITQQQINQYQWQAADGVARIVNPYDNKFNPFIATDIGGIEYTSDLLLMLNEFDSFSQKHQYQTNAPDGIYSGEAFEVIKAVLDVAYNKPRPVKSKQEAINLENLNRSVFDFLRLKPSHLPAVLTTQPGEEWKDRYREVWYYRYWVYADWTEALYSDYVKFKTYADFEVYYKTEMNYYTNREWHLITPPAEQEAETPIDVLKRTNYIVPADEANCVAETVLHDEVGMVTFAMEEYAKVVTQQLQSTVTQKDQRIAELEREAEQLKDKLIEINNLCGTINFSSHNQMREAIEGAVELSELPTRPKH